MAARCDPERLRPLIDGRLPAADRAALERHLGDCPACQAALDELAGDDRWWGAARRFLAGRTDPSDPTPMPPGPLYFLAPSDRPGALGRLGPYEVEGELGRGGMGVVLRAFDPALRRAVAVKVLTTALSYSGPARERFAREARAAAAVAHEHVVAVHAAEAGGGVPYLVMEYVPGRSLQQRLDESGPLDLEEVLRVGAEVARGLAAAHERGVIHRDVKPANILLEDGTGRVKITDFGLARAVGEAGVTHSGVVVGTPQYMSPEQARGGPLDARADLFSLGSTLYTAYVGVPPFRAESALAVLRAIVEDAPRPLAEVRPGAPRWFAAVLGRLLAKDPGRRYRSAAEVADLLGRCREHARRPGVAPLPEGLEPPPRRRWAVAAAGGVGLAILVGLVATYRPVGEPRDQSGRHETGSGSPPATDAPPWDVREFEDALGKVDRELGTIDGSLHTPSPTPPADGTVEELNRRLDILERELAADRP